MSACRGAWRHRGSAPSLPGPSFLYSCGRVTHRSSFGTRWPSSDPRGGPQSPVSWVLLPSPALGSRPVAVLMGRAPPRARRRRPWSWSASPSPQLMPRLIMGSSPSLDPRDLKTLDGCCCGPPGRPRGPDEGRRCSRAFSTTRSPSAVLPAGRGALCLGQSTGC